MSENSATYFVKIRGRVLGPFVMSRLQEMSAQGQLSRVHNVSLDGESWKRAGEYPEIFLSPRSTSSAAQPISPQNAVSPSFSKPQIVVAEVLSEQPKAETFQRDPVDTVNQTTTSPDIPAAAELSGTEELQLQPIDDSPVSSPSKQSLQRTVEAHDSPKLKQDKSPSQTTQDRNSQPPSVDQSDVRSKSPDDNWHYSGGHDSKGPITLQQLRSYIKFGKVAEADLVWKPGFSDWKTADEVAELRAAFGDVPQRVRDASRSSTATSTPKDRWKNSLATEPTSEHQVDGGSATQTKPNPSPNFESQPYRLAPLTSNPPRHAGKRLSSQMDVYVQGTVKRMVPWLIACCVASSFGCLISFTSLVHSLLNTPQQFGGLMLAKYGCYLATWIAAVFTTVTLVYYLAASIKFANAGGRENYHLSKFWLHKFWLAMTFLLVLGMSTMLVAVFTGGTSDSTTPSNDNQVIVPTIRT